MIWHTVLYNGEADMLECLLTEAADVVDRFVIVEAKETFSGKIRGYPKALDARFEPWHDKIIHQWIDLPESDDPWLRERFARQACHTVTKGRAIPGDLFVHGDVDEIIKPATYELDGPYPVVVSAEHYIFNIGWKGSDWWGPVICPWRDDLDVAQMRTDRTSQFNHVPGGWHLSWFGTLAERRRKLKSFSHTEHVEELLPMMDTMPRDGKTPNWWQGQLAKQNWGLVPEGTLPRYILDLKCPPFWIKEPDRADVD